MADETGIQEVFRRLAEDERRTAAISDEVQRAVAGGRKVLVLTERTAHLDAIGGALKGRGAEPFVLHGRMSRKQRARLIAGLDALPPSAPRDEAGHRSCRLRLARAGSRVWCAAVYLPARVSSVLTRLAGKTARASSDRTSLCCAFHAAFSLLERVTNLSRFLSML